MTKRLFAAVVALSVVLLATASPRDMPAWATDPAVPGPTLPPVGRSLFDFVVADGVPFPFEALVRKVEADAGCAPGECVKPVLIPLGRSLQRTAAAPDFFAFPRVVVAVTGEGAGPMLARDRLYLGYQEKANLVEVISYNESAARFEFQLVRDYRAGLTPQVVYANRDVCTACHQNHAPIFSRPVWDETNANPKIAGRLGAARKSFYGIPVHRGVDIPNAIDDATDRANRIGATQRIWREACDAACRPAALTAALQYRLSGERGFEASTLAGALARGFAVRWPSGLAIPNPDLPNRDPLAFVPGTIGVAQSHVAADLEPLAPRAPLEVWTAEDPLLVRRFVMGLAELIAETDVRELDAALTRRGAAAPRRTFIAACTMSGKRYDCVGEVTLRGNATTVDAIGFGGEPLAHYTLENGVVSSQGRRARTASGDSIERLAMRQAGGKGEVKVTVVADFASVRAAIANFAWPDAPFSRARMRDVLGLDHRATCCEDSAGLEPPQKDIEPALPLPAPAGEFQRQCAACHRTPDGFPPNFLAGDTQRVRASLAHCAPRIFVRLAMWQMPPGARDKVPMPPPLASRGGSPWAQTAPDPAIALLQSEVAGWLRAETGRIPDAAELLARGYENLRPCLPAGG
jgi:mono/diheme cytochrome c family protein